MGAITNVLIRPGTQLTRLQILDLIQWPAMVVTVTAAWFVASRSRARRKLGFWLFLASNVFWTVWAVPAHAYALITLQVCLAFMNIRGERRNAAPSCARSSQSSNPLAYVADTVAIMRGRSESSRLIRYVGNVKYSVPIVA